MKQIECNKSSSPCALARNLLGVDMFEEPLLVPALHVMGAADPLTLSRSDASSDLLALLEPQYGGRRSGGGGISGGSRESSAVSMWMTRIPLTYAQPSALLHRGGHSFPSAGVGRGKEVVSDFFARMRFSS